MSIPAATMETVLTRIDQALTGPMTLPTESFAGQPYHVLVSCVVSLRTRDAVTEVVGRRVLAAVPDLESLSRFDPERLAELISPAGFYRRKAAQLVAAAEIIGKRFGGAVPREIDDLLTLPGVGRKTANLVRTLGYGLPGVCVDTHVHRICNRLGFVATARPDDTEMALRDTLPEHWWLAINRLLVQWGQQRCLPRFPRCGTCPVADLCPRIGVADAR